MSPTCPPSSPPAASILKPGGMMIAATINRTMKAWLLAIVGAEYVLRWLPRGTHSYDKLVTPAELTAAFRAAGLAVAAKPASCTCRSPTAGGCRATWTSTT